MYMLTINPTHACTESVCYHSSTAVSGEKGGGVGRVLHFSAFILNRVYIYSKNESLNMVIVKEY